MHLEYIEYLIVPDQIQSDCKARAEVPTAQSTNSTKPFRFSFHPSQSLGLLPAASSTFAASQTQLGSLCASFLGRFLVQKKVVKFPEKYFGGLVCSGGMAGVPPRQLLLSASKEHQARKTHRKEKVSKDDFYAFLTVGAVSDECVGCLSITSSSSFSSGVPLVPLLPYFSIHLHDF